MTTAEIEMNLLCFVFSKTENRTTPNDGYRCLPKFVKTKRSGKSRSANGMWNPLSDGIAWRQEMCELLTTQRSKSITADNFTALVTTGSGARGRDFLSCRRRRPAGANNVQSCSCKFRRSFPILRSSRKLVSCVIFYLANDFGSD